jgi:hypothetical protein
MALAPNERLNLTLLDRHLTYGHGPCYGALTSPITPLTSPPQLAHLDMREIDAGDGGLVALAAAGTRGALAQLKHLDLRHNPFGNAGTGALADALSSNLAPVVVFASLARLYLQSGNARLRSAASDRRIELSGGII